MPHEISETPIALHETSNAKNKLHADKTSGAGQGMADNVLDK